MNWTNTKCVVLCAGKGDRLSSVYVEKPKVMIEIRDRPILSYVIDYWKNFTNDFIFVVKFKREQIITFIKKLPINSQFIEQKELKGIADAVLYVKDKVSWRFIVVLGDCLCKGHFNFPEDMEQGVGVWETENVEDIKQSYSIEIKSNLIVKVEEKPKKAFNNLCGMGFYFFDKKVFNYIKLTKPSKLRNEIEITDVIQNMIEAGEEITPVFFQGDYLNINHSEDVEKTEGIFLK